MGQHAIGWSRGGLTTKTRVLVDGLGRPLVIAVTPGQANGSPALLPMLRELSVPHRRPAADRPDALPAAKAYSSRGHAGSCARTGSPRSSPSLPIRSRIASAAAVIVAGH